MKLFHVADIHLGRRRLDGRLPHSDLAAAFGFVAERAIDEKADVFLIAGDLFDRPTVEPPHLRQAQQILGRLKVSGIRVIAGRLGFGAKSRVLGGIRRGSVCGSRLPWRCHAV